jgi:hypothetical protein
MRLLLLAVGAIAIAAAAYLGNAGKRSSYSSYSREQLTVLERAYESVIERSASAGTPTPTVAGGAAAPSGAARPASGPGLGDRGDARSRPSSLTPPPGITAEEAQVSLSLLQDEQRRRMLLPVAWAVGAVSLLGTLLVRSGWTRRPRGEDGRFLTAVGSPEIALQGERQKAAKLLGVTVDAPANVVEAALRAQLSSRDPERMVGLAPDLRRLALEQREALLRARDLLVGRAVQKQ